MVPSYKQAKGIASLVCTFAMHIRSLQ